MGIALWVGIWGRRFSGAVGSYGEYGICGKFLRGLLSGLGLPGSCVEE